MPAAIGGFGHNGIIGSVETYNGESWEEIGPLVNPRSNASAVVWKDSTYIVGGYFGGSWASVLDTIEKY